MGKGKRVIMILSNPFQPDPRVYREAKTLVDEGFEVTILCWDRDVQFPEREDVDGIDVVRISIRGQYGKKLISLLHFIRFYIVVFKRLMNSSFDILHCHDFDTLVVGYCVAKYHKCGIVFDAHEPVYYGYLPGWFHHVTIQYLEKWLTKRVDAIIVTNYYQVKKYKSYGVENIEVIANHPKKSFWKNRPAKTASNTWKIGWIGRMDIDCGIKELLSVFSILFERGCTVELFLAGRVMDNAKAIIEQAQKQYGDHIKVLKPVSFFQVPDLYESIDISLLLYKPIPNYRLHTAAKIFECLASGTPVIVANVGETPEIVQRTGCGIVMDDYNCVGIANAVVELMNDTSLYSTMSKNGLKAFESDYNWEKTSQQLLSVYEHIS